MQSSLLVSTDWLREHLEDPHVIILDASIISTASKQPSAYPDLQIVGARFFDMKGSFSDTESDLPNMMPSPEKFSEACCKLGINQNSQIVVYDDRGIYTSPRVWWMFRTMGHESVAVLDGGLPAWIAEGGPTEAKKTSTVEVGNFVGNFQKGWVRNSQQLLSNLQEADETVLDARSEGRFKGIAPEPRAGSKGGHIPQSSSLPYTQVLRDGKFLPKSELAELFAELDLGDKPLVFSCGSGITACIILLASEQVLSNEKSVYDGSWSEWGDAQRDFPIST